MEHNLSTDPLLLIVEDDDVDFRGIKRALKRAQLPLTVERAHNGEEALDLLRSGALPPTQGVIIFLDLSMPIMDGHAFLQELRTDPKLKGTVVFVMSTSEDERDIRGAFGRQVAGYFLKQQLGDHRVLVELLQHYVRLGVVPPLEALSA